MLIDIAYASTSTSTYGAYYGIKTSTLAGTEGNGTWKRADGLATATVSGSNVSVAYSGVSSVAPFSLTYNSILQGSSPYSYNGFFRGAPSTAGSGVPFVGVLLSSSIVLIGDITGLSVWSKQ